MRKTSSSKTRAKDPDDLLPEYNLRELFKNGVRGKYAKAYRAGTILVALAPDVKKAFPDDAAVNTALRLVMELRKVGLTERPRKERRRA
jgi:hypothetical protein